MGLQAVGLVSGGKDSVFALQCAVALGHRICAIATLLPRNNALEADSYMYQSVGTGVTGAIAECMGIPLFSSEIRGRPLLINSLSYETTPGDEVEDLYDLLVLVKDAMPEIEAVTCGAILSEFQRRRLEHVCQRLGLVPICLLWHKAQEVLLKEMCAVGLHAVLVKTASMGLTRRNLGKCISDLLDHFLDLNRKYDFHVCGEGGEYETLTLDCPLYTEAAIAITRWKEVCQCEDPVAPIWLLSPEDWILVPKAKKKDGSTNPCGLGMQELEHQRFEVYKDLVKTAVQGWNVQQGTQGAAGSTSVNRIEKDSVEAPPVTCNARQHLWKVRIQNTLKCRGILAADVTACCNQPQGESLPCGAHVAKAFADAEVPQDLRASLFDVLNNWLDEQMGAFPSGCYVSSEAAYKDPSDAKVAVRPIQTICQAISSSFHALIEEFFSSKGFPEHPMTFLQMSLPAGVLLRFRVLFSLAHSSANCVSPRPSFLLENPQDVAVLHVHSLNMWIPSCRQKSRCSRQPSSKCHSLCRNCQGIRCAKRMHGATRTEAASAPEILFLRAVDGMVPFSGESPATGSNPYLKHLMREEDKDCLEGTGVEEHGLKDSGKEDPGLDIALQTVSACLSLQQSLSLLRSDGRGFPSSASCFFPLETNMPEEFHFNDFPPLCLLVYVHIAPVLQGGEKEAKRKLRIVEELVRSLLRRWGVQDKHKGVIVVAGVPRLPGGAKVMVLPVGETAARWGGVRRGLTSVASFEKHLYGEGDAFRKTLQLCIHSLKSPSAEVPWICSSVACITFEEYYDDGATRTLTSFLEELRKSFYALLQQKIENENGVESVTHLEVFVFYCSSFPNTSFHVSTHLYEIKCAETITAVCIEGRVTHDIAPMISFFSSEELAGGSVQILLSSMA
ncbi:uncharacterized protein LOC34621908 [Cyclospora cayetanensis]|uniref:Diphthine--ammonia ligase n=1 Tax=Cyclospora cayetanensis TaxID=88456 RepID=A0A6P6RXG8_9EIME|nr:uncharacterized protein LOC34621908 [Cyclospora cayetanensis]